MNLTFSRIALTIAFQAIGNVVSARTPREILKNVKLIANRPAAILIATNGDGIGIRYKLDDPGFGEGTPPAEGILLPAARMVAILRELTGDTISLHFENGTLTLKCGYSRFTLQLEDPKDFPDVAMFDEVNFFEMTAGDVRKAIRRTCFAREHRLDDRNIIDFMAGPVGIECKVKGPAAPVRQQCRRYLAFPTVESLILVTSKRSHLWPGTELDGKPFASVYVALGSFL